jgi:hypothetical protein
MIFYNKKFYPIELKSKIKDFMTIRNVARKGKLKLQLIY